MSESAKKAFVVFTYVVLIVSTLLVFGQAGNFNSINYDDSAYVYGNQHVLSGLTADGVVWAFTTGHTGNWHPLTWLSLMLGCQLFGPNPGWMHLVNVLLHLANALLLFAVLKKMTGALWQSAFVAAAFALHPMHVESVAWIAERKDVLSTLFMLLTLAAYIGYVKRPSIFRYLIALTLFAAGLMAKPMLVTLPLLLLLLDYWPLNRFDPQPAKTSGRQNRKPSPIGAGRPPAYRIMVEKIPFFVLAAASSAVTLVVQRAGGAMTGIAVVPLHIRIANAFLSYAKYVGKMFWPKNLAVFYPFDAGSIASWQVAMSVLLLLVISILVIRLGRRRKYLTVGWFWFVITLLPVIGLVQVGKQAIADRYAYIPYIGLFIAIAWGLPELLWKLPQRKTAMGLSMAISLTVLGIVAHRQASYWQDSATLAWHALEVTQGNYVAYNNRGIAYGDLGRSAEAIGDFSEAIRINPGYDEAYNNLGIIYKRLGHLQEAVDAYKQAIKIKPNYAEAYNNLGNGYSRLGRGTEAIGAYEQAIKIKPDYVEACYNLAWFVATNAEVMNRDTNEAILLASRACRLTNYKNPLFLGTLAAALASAGRFSEAVDTANRAMSLAEAANQPQIKNAIQYHLSFYKQGKPYIEPSPRPLPEAPKP
jgi:tetratricopeptide (TPR) repeat protein